MKASSLETTPVKAYENFFLFCAQNGLNRRNLRDKWVVFRVTDEEGQGYLQGRKDGNGSTSWLRIQEVDVKGVLDDM